MSTQAAAIVAAIDRAEPIIADATMSFDEKVAALVKAGIDKATAGEMIAAASGGLSGVDSDGTAWRA